MMARMSTRIRHTLTYDAPLMDVAAMLADPDFREQVCEATGMLRHEVTVTGAGTGMYVEIDQTQSAAGVPSFAQKFVGDEINIVQVERWTTVDTADVTVSIPGKPGEMSGSITLRENAGTTTEDVVLDIRVGIPLVGGKIEKLVGDLLIAALKIENATGRGYLSA
jgi:hypothetical protein